MTRAAARRSAKGAWRDARGRVFGAAGAKSRCSTPEIAILDVILEVDHMELPNLTGALPLWVKALIAMALLAAIVGGFKACTATTNHKTDAGLNAARGEGAATATSDGLKGVLQDAETANKAGAAVAAGGQRAYDVCVRTSDTPENCAAPAAR